MPSATIVGAVTHIWQRRTLLSYLLWPVSILYCTVATARRRAYQVGLASAYRMHVPVLVVGNITVGGTGKTPLVIWLVDELRKRGRVPGVVSRGYGGRPVTLPHDVGADSDPHTAGDEPVLIARRAACPVVVHPDRVVAARHLVDRHACDVVIADDGLQHYRLARDVEIAVIDGERRFGNGFCLPAGPLREPPSRIGRCDVTVVNGDAGTGEISMRLRVSRLVALGDPSRTQTLDAWRGRRAHAVAGIGNPDRFFARLEEAGIDVIRHAFPDHFRFNASDLAFNDGLPTIMTEKDAVKCAPFAAEGTWYAEVETEVNPNFTDTVLTMLKVRR